MLDPTIDCEDLPPPPEFCTEPDCDDPCLENPLLSLGPGTVIVIDGTATWNDPTETAQLPFCFENPNNCDPLGPEPAKVVYTSNATKLFPAHYALLEIESRTTPLPLGGNVYVKGRRNYALNVLGTAIVETFPGGASAVNGSTQYSITFTDVCADATYAACGEVVG